MGLSTFKFLSMDRSKWAQAPSFSLVGRGQGRGGERERQVWAPMWFFPEHIHLSTPLPAKACLGSTHRIWYKLKTKLGPRKTIHRERVRAPGRLWPRAMRALTLPGGSEGRSGAQGGSQVPAVSVSAPFPPSETESSTFGEQIRHGGEGGPSIKGADYPGKKQAGLAWSPKEQTWLQSRLPHFPVLTVPPLRHLYNTESKNVIPARDFKGKHLGKRCIGT